MDQVLNWKKTLARKDPGINPLDAACKNHDIAYAQNPNSLSARHQADYQLDQSAWERFKSKDPSAREKAAAWFITTVMKGKQRLGMGCKMSQPQKKQMVSTKNRKCHKKKKECKKNSGFWERNS